MNTSEWAAAYATADVPVFPCGPAKRSAIPRCQRCDDTGNRPGSAGYLACAASGRIGHGLYDATADVDRVEGWWSRHPDCLIGVPTTGLLIVDLDVDPADPMATWRWWCDTAEPEDWQIGDTLMSETPSIGLHIWWRAPEGVEVRNSAGKLAPHVDVRVTGGYVIVPPTTTPTGAYEWLNPTTPIAAAPAWLVKLCATPAPRTVAPAPTSRPEGRYGLGALEAELGRLAVAPEGRRNDTLVRAAYRIGPRGRRPTLRAPRPRPARVGRAGHRAHRHRDQRHHPLRHAVRRPAPPEGRMTVTDDAWLDELEQQGARAAEATEERDLLAGLRNGAWLHEQTFPPLKYHLPGVIPEGSTLLVGPPKIGKSWFVLALALATSCGGRALGQQVDARPTLYLALEDGDRRMQDRCRVLLGDDPIPAAFEYLTVIEPMTILATLTAWMDRYPGAEPLAIVDTLGRVMPPALMGESAYQRDYRVGAALKALTDERPGAGLVVNHHDRKAASEDFVEKVSGSNGLAGAADTILVLARARHEQTGIINVTGRDGPEGEYAVTFDGNHGAWSLDGDTLVSSAARAVERRTSDGLDERSRSIVAYAAEHPEGVRAAQVAAAVGIDEGQARQYLGRLVDSDRLVRVTRGLYTAVANVALSRSDHAPVSSGHQASRQRDKRDTRDTPMSGRRHRASRGGHMTTITVIGNASRDPELRYTPNGAGVATFGLAVNRRKKDGDKWVEAGVAWFNVTCWRDPRPERLRLDREGHARRGGRPP